MRNDNIMEHMVNHFSESPSDVTLLLEDLALCTAAYTAINYVLDQIASG